MGAEIGIVELGGIEKMDMTRGFTGFRNVDKGDDLRPALLDLSQVIFRRGTRINKMSCAKFFTLLQFFTKNVRGTIVTTNWITQTNKN